MRDFSISEDLGKEPELEVSRILLPEFGADVCAYIKQMTAWDRDKRCDRWFENYKQQCIEEEVEYVGRVPWVAAACVCKEDGGFRAPTKLEVIELAEKFAKQKATVVERIFRAAGEVNAMGDAAVEKLEKK